MYAEVHSNCTNAIQVVKDIMDGATERIGTLVRDAGMTNRQLGNLLGLSVASANGKLNGNIGWTARDIVVLSEYFGVSTDYLFGRSNEGVAV